MDWAEGLSSAQSGFDKTKEFHSILLPAHPGQGLCFTEHITALGVVLGKLVAALGTARHLLFIGTAFLAEALRSLTRLFVRGIRATLLQLAVRALFTQTQRQL